MLFLKYILKLKKLRTNHNFLVFLKILELEFKSWSNFLNAFDLILDLFKTYKRFKTFISVEFKYLQALLIPNIKTSLKNRS